ncbi:MAG: hypothetical protein U0401_14675 [Anaerolineae bacterium]
MRQQIAPLGITLEELKEKGYYRPPVEAEAEAEKEPTFNTPSGKMELASRTWPKVMASLPCRSGKNHRPMSRPFSC